jgi:hypothetical protein
MIKLRYEDFFGSAKAIANLIPLALDTGGCQLFVVPAHLWRPRSCVRREPVCAPIPFPVRLRKVS